MKVVATDWDLGTEGPARRVLERAGWELVVARCADNRELIEAAHDAQALLVRYASLPREVLGHLPELRFISRMGIGPWEVDLAGAAEHQVAVADCPEYCTDESVAHTLALILALNRGLLDAPGAVAGGQWGSYGGKHPILSTADLVLGLVGLGRMGQGIAAVARALGMDVIGYDPYVLGVPEGVDQVDLPTLLSDSDIVCLLCPATPGMVPLIDEHALSQMKPTAYLVNTARGNLVDEAALIAALDAGKLAGAALDVLTDEPPSPDNPLLGRADVLVTPHVAYLSDQSQHELKVYAARNVVHYFTGEPVGGLLTPDFRRD
ncbi:MAG: C-terminal binding protein [Armatimonadetes bacterium]|nr:C-terminal binding protein [Armatimonadota bacterium]